MIPNAKDMFCMILKANFKSSILNFISNFFLTFSKSYLCICAPIYIIIVSLSSFVQQVLPVSRVCSKNNQTVKKSPKRKLRLCGCLYDTKGMLYSRLLCLSKCLLLFLPCIVVS